MTKRELLLDVIGEARDEYLEEVHRRVKSVKSRRKKSVPIAASLVLVVGLAFSGVYMLLNRGAGSSYAASGIAAGGYFYYQNPGDGFFRYTPEEGSVRLTRKCLFTNDWSDYTANDVGFYYVKDKWIYRVRHGSTKSEKLYHFEEDKPFPCLYPSGAKDITVDVVYYEGADEDHHEIFVLDGETGERKETLMEQHIAREEWDALHDVDHSDFFDERDEMIRRNTFCADTIAYTLSDRTLELVLEDYTYEATSYRLTENGEPMTTEFADPYDVRTAGDSLVFTLGYALNNSLSIGQWENSFMIVSPDGTQHKVAAQAIGSEDYFFTTDQYGDDTGRQLYAVSVRSGEKLPLKWDAPDDYLMAMDSDGKYLWLNYFSQIACYRIEYENGDPTALTLIDDNIITND